MARFDVYAGLGAGKSYVVDVQTELLGRLATRVVSPLLPRGTAKPVQDLNPVVQVDDREYVVMTQELSAVARSDLRRRVGSLAERRDEITRALDGLLTGL